MRKTWQQQEMTKQPAGRKYQQLGESNRWRRFGENNEI